MKKTLKITAILAVAMIAIILLVVYQVNKPRLIGEVYAEDSKYIVSFIETHGPIFFGTSEVKIELRSNDEETAEKQEISTSVFNDGKTLDDTNWKVNFKNDHVEITLTGEEQQDEVTKIYYIQKFSDNH